MATARTEFRTLVFILELTEEEVDDLRNLLNISTALKGAINGITG